MPQPGRNWDRSGDTLYRYGYNGMETDGEVKEERGNHYTTYFRQYDPRLGRWWSTDPVVQPGESPYAAMYNNPILFSDPLGNDPGGDNPLDPSPQGGLNQHGGGGGGGGGSGGGSGSWMQDMAREVDKMLKRLGEEGKKLGGERLAGGVLKGAAAARGLVFSQGSSRDIYVGSGGSGTSLHPFAQTGLPSSARTDHPVATEAPQFNLLPVVPNTVPIPSVRPEVLPTTPPPITTNPIAIGNPFLMNVASYEAYRKTPEGQAFVSQAGVNPGIALTEFVYGLTQDGVVTVTGSYASGGGADGKTQKQAKLNLYVFGMTTWMGFLQTGAATTTTTTTTQVPLRSPTGVGVAGRASAPVMEGFTQVETQIINEARTILSSEGMTTIRSAQQAGQTVEVQIGGRIIIYEPGLPASGMTAFGENGFLIGPQAFASEVELGQTILHELYRLSTSQSAAGVSQVLVTQETANAFNFASRAIQHVIVP